MKKISVKLKGNSVDYKFSKTAKLVIAAVLSAMAVVLIMLIHLPIFPAAPFLEYDPADIPIFIGAFLLGTPWGIAITIAASVIQGITVSAQSGFWGIIMHILSTGSFILVSSLFYKKYNGILGLALSLLLGVVTMTTVMIFCNLVITPIFLGTPIEAVKDMLIPIIIPFNLIKSAINAAVTFVVFNAIKTILCKLK